MRPDKERINGPYKHGDRWRVVASGTGGRQVARSFATYAEAEATIEAARSKSQGVTVRAAVDAYVQKMRDRELRASSIESAEDRLAIILGLAVNGNRPLRWLRNRGVELYDAAQIGHAPDTHRNALAAGRSFGKFCLKMRWLKLNPFADVEGVGRRRHGKEQLRGSEAIKLTDLCLSLGIEPAPIAVLAVLILGPRASEVIDREVRDLDNGGKLLWIPDSKTDAGKRTLDVPGLLQPLLLALAKDRIGAAPLFRRRDGSKATRHWILYHCKRLCAVAGVPVITVHGLRGTHGSLARRGGATGELVAAQLGHASVGITNRAYIQAGASQAADADVVLGVIRGGKP